MPKLLLKLLQRLLPRRLKKPERLPRLPESKNSPRKLSRASGAMVRKEKTSSLLPAMTTLLFRARSTNS